MQLLFETFRYKVKKSRTGAGCIGLNYFFFYFYTSVYQCVKNDTLLL